MRNLFEATENKKIAGECFVTNKPSDDLLNQITEFNEKQDKTEHNIKKFSALFIAVMFVIWIVGDVLNFPSEIEIPCGLITIFGYPVLRLIGSVWLCRPSLKRTALELEQQSLSSMNTPYNAETLEIFVPLKKDSTGWVHDNKNGFICDNKLVVMYSDNENLFLADLTGTLSIPLTAFNSIEQNTKKCRIKKWIQDRKISEFKKYGVRVHSGLEFFLPFWLSMHFSSKIIVSYRSVEIRTLQGEYTLCIPEYETEKFCELTKLKIYS